MAIWDRKRRRDEFEAVALAHLDELYRTARCRLGDAIAAEDVVQETYLKAWRSFSTFERGTNCRAWLHRILANVIRDLQRKQSREPHRDSSEHILKLISDERGAVSDPGVERALERLSDEQRAVVLLADVEELTYRETARALGIPLGTVMSRLSRARARLRKHLNRTSDTQQRDRQWTTVRTT